MELYEKLAAIEEIKQLKARYVRAVDSKNWELLRTTYADDVELDSRGSCVDPATGINHMPDYDETIYRGAETGIKMVQTLLPSIVSVHQIMTPEIEILNKTEARAIWPMADRLKPMANGPSFELIGWGHYHETYERLESGWKIKTLKLTRVRVDKIATTS